MTPRIERHLRTPLIAATILSGTLLAAQPDGAALQRREPPFQLLILGPNGARHLGGNSGDSLLGVHLADVPAAVQRAADSVATGRELPTRCKRYFWHGKRIVVWYALYCAASPGGRDYSAQTLVAFDGDGRMFGTPLRWSEAEDIRLGR